MPVWVALYCLFFSLVHLSFSFFTSLWVRDLVPSGGLVHTLSWGRFFSPKPHKFQSKLSIIKSKPCRVSLLITPLIYDDIPLIIINFDFRHFIEIKTMCVRGRLRIVRAWSCYENVKWKISLKNTCQMNNLANDLRFLKQCEYFSRKKSQKEPSTTFPFLFLLGINNDEKVLQIWYDRNVN